MFSATYESHYYWLTHKELFCPPLCELQIRRTTTTTTRAAITATARNRPSNPKLTPMAMIPPIESWEDAEVPGMEVGGEEVVGTVGGGEEVAGQVVEFSWEGERRCGWWIHTYSYAAYWHMQWYSLSLVGRFAQHKIMNTNVTANLRLIEDNLDRKQSITLHCKL